MSYHISVYNAGEAFYPFGDVEPFLELGFNDGIDFATPAGLLDGESAVFSAVLLICFPFRPVFRKHGLDLVHGVVNDGLAEFAFPNCDCTPADGFKSLDIDEVPLLITCNLILPEFSPRFWHDEFAAALVPMPEAAVHEDAGAVFGQHDVRSPGQCADAFAESVSPMPQFTPDSLFWACVLRMYARHTFVALIGCHAVRHGSMSVDLRNLAFRTNLVTFKKYSASS